MLWPLGIVGLIMVSIYGVAIAIDHLPETVTEEISKRAGLASKTQDYIARRTEIDYATYVRFRGKLAMK